MIAALYVETGGVYYGLPDVDPWDETRDARKYDGPWPVVAHPPCERWGRYWSGGPDWLGRGLPPKKLGDDDGCFEAALWAVRRWGGVLEHPADSRAWKRFNLLPPGAMTGWTTADHGWEVGVDCDRGGWTGWTCRVEQGHYGHRARKATWLYACRLPSLPSLQWGPAWRELRQSDVERVATGQRRATRTGICQRMSRKQRRATPIPFRDLLLSIARSARQPGDPTDGGTTR